MNGTEARQVDAVLLGRFALARLERFAERAAEADASGLAGWRGLARHAVFSAYRDCLALGLAADARAILAGRACRVGAAAERPRLDEGTARPGA
jgi:hypothetical protein